MLSTGLAVDQLQEAAPFSCSTVAPCYPTGSSFLDLYGLDADSKVGSVEAELRSSRQSPCFLLMRLRPLRPATRLCSS